MSIYSLKCWVSKIHEYYLLSVWTHSFHLVSSRRRLSAIITAAVYEGKVLRIESSNNNNKQSEKERATRTFCFFVLFMHMIRHISNTMNLIHIKPIIHFWFKRTTLYESVYIFWLKTIKKKMKKTNVDANRSSADHKKEIDINDKYHHPSVYMRTCYSKRCES